MAITFYPYEDDLESSTLLEKIETLMDAAERYKAFMLDAANAKMISPTDPKKRATPRDLSASYNWGEIAKLLRDIRDMSESSSINKLAKADHLTKLAEIYEVLRAAKMPKLEAVRIALMNEAAQLRSSASQVA